MKLVKLSLTAFRSYGEKTDVFIEDNLTAIVGKNDIGKSTILEALEIFFNNDTVKIDKYDLCINSADPIVEIACAFKDFPDEIIIDTSSTTTLKDEFLLNEQGQFEIVKRYDCSKSAIKPTVFCRAYYPKYEDYSQLHSLKNSDLKKIVSELRIPDDEIDRRSNVSLRSAIFRAINADDKFENQLVSLEKEDGKKIYDKIKKKLPLYVLFQADRASKDDDNEVQDPMKVAVKKAISEVQTELDQIKMKVQEKAQESARRTLAKLNEMNPNLANDLRPNFKSEPKWDSIFKLSLTDDDSIPINKRGSGTRRLILLNYFRAEAERKKDDKNSPSVIYAIEEPETSQHPDNQKMLIKALQELSAKEHCQVLITTHVPRLAGLIETNALRFLIEESSGRKLYNLCNDGVLSKIADTLGVLPDRRVQVILFVEGPRDVEFFENITPIIRSIEGAMPDIVNDYRVAIFPLGGSTLNQWVNKHYTRDLNVAEVHIYDLDDPSDPKYQSAADKVNNRPDNSCAFLTSKRELENYIHSDAIRREFGFVISFGDFDDVPTLIAIEQAKIDYPNKSWSSLGRNQRKKREGLIKRKLNQVVVKDMSATELTAIDKNNEILNWFKEIKLRIE